ncbi:MAG: exopolysaccharide biosynthesis polyprenyl glycosylphosphotransferase [bacterium]|nr:exopolysaccharide biosynthesis polyprenyl glycosylphosphotransferase [bacterium]
MGISNRAEALFLFAGDLVLFYVSLFLTLFFRYGSELDGELLELHLLPFSILFIFWLLSFFVAGLYEKQTLLFQKRLPQLLSRALIVNSIFAVLFFYFIPAFEITPKSNLFIYLFVSFVLLLLWRSFSFTVGGGSQKQNAIIIGSGGEFREIEEEVNQNPRYHIRFVASFDADKLSGTDIEEEIVRLVYSEGISFIAVDLKNETLQPLLPKLYNLLFQRVRFVDTHRVYEDIFDRVPISLLKYHWFLEHISTLPKWSYDAGKRLMDILISIPLLVIPVLTFPFVWLAVKLQDRGSVFIWQERVGKNNALIKILKYRTMKFNDEGREAEDNEVTRVGAFLRKSRLDEFPQLWNVLMGDLSLIGPRPELPALVRKYEESVPYYNIRHLIKPGLSGWAQIYHDEHPHHGANVDKTKQKLSYDLYYIKNRSLFLDLKIALRTIQTLLSRSGI